MLRALLAPLALLPLLAAGPPPTPVVVSTPGSPLPLLRQLHVSGARVLGHGFAARLGPGQLQRLRAVPGVVVEPDRRLEVSAVSWGLDRVDQRSLPLNDRYAAPDTASSVHAYVIDTGLDVTHPDLSGRATVGFDALGGDGRDCNGHGTHVAGVVGGTRWGVAKKVQLVAVRVMDCSGRSTTGDVLAGVDWVRRNAVRPAVANLSLGGSFSAVLDRAVDDLADSGVFVSVAAGNSGADACATSPAAASKVLTVAASDRRYVRAPWSNTGSCVDLFAPGVAVTSDWPGGGTRSLSGTSMAAPFVAGAAAVYEDRHPEATTADVVAWLEEHASKKKLTKVPAGTPNALLYVRGM